MRQEEAKCLQKWHLLHFVELHQPIWIMNARVLFCVLKNFRLAYAFTFLESSLNIANVSIPTTSRQQKTITSRQQIESDNVAEDNGNYYILQYFKAITFT